ncbi:sensor histidine kinase [Syntrophobacter fumaroxidans]|uniref:histidine kinase n=1 Tax=Syntrophobacter fumaroxidans (strain DSM 10017 / MPOB) TaxID=335543 RepID=A0LLT5_SYNFM|nr:HAMP domain-containing sensor histidine kinase [Syntrophobacter fumaroxidans]ABK18387.1 histidine kinase [Syntrophobacter fumaroxidans MPOB]
MGKREGNSTGPVGENHAESAQQESLLNIRDRVRAKKNDYGRYNLERSQEEAFATFFDLAQEYTSIDNLYQVCVAVPKEFFGLESSLYVFNPKRCRLEKVCSSLDGLVPVELRETAGLSLKSRPYETEDTWVFPIHGNETLTKQYPFLNQSEVLGLFEIFPKDLLDARKHFFLEKFTNRIGYNLHQKMLIQQNIDHIKFINQLVADIEHNVISPNLYYRLFLIRLKKHIAAYGQLQARLRDLILFLRDGDEALSRELCEIHHALDESNQRLDEAARGLGKHYEHTSLFLETLLRRDHFEKGTYVLRRQSCNFRTEIIQPLLERYLPLFEKKGITVDNRLENVPDEHVTLFVDKGLISQVFDNFFSNALKYTREVEDQLGNKIKLVSYNRQILRDCFGEGMHGVRFNFFTTGEPLSEKEARKLFREGFRASGSRTEKGSGHGLHFVKNVVEIHGGDVGCEPQRYGNLIYFTLPMKEQTQFTV